MRQSNVQYAAAPSAASRSKPYSSSPQPLSPIPAPLPHPIHFATRKRKKNITQRRRVRGDSAERSGENKTSLPHPSFSPPPHQLPPNDQPFNPPTSFQNHDHFPH